jgi:hypothetical protein
MSQAHTCNSSTQEAKRGGFQVLDQPEQHRETLSNKNLKTKTYMNK